MLDLIKEIEIEGCRRREGGVSIQMWENGKCMLRKIANSTVCEFGPFLEGNSCKVKSDNSIGILEMLLQLHLELEG